MRHIVATLYIAALLKCRERRAHTRLDVRHRVVPTSLSGYFERRAAHSLTLACEVLYGLPHLLYLAKAELGLVEKYEMLVKVVVGVQHKALGCETGVAACASRLLHIVLQRVGYVVVDHKPHVALVDPHAESRRGHNDVHSSRHKLILVLYLLIGVHLAVERQSLHSVAGELRCEFACALCARHIHDRRARSQLHKFAKLRILVVIRINVYYLIAQVLS